MDNERILPILLVSCFLILFLSPGFGVETMGTMEQATSLTPHEKEMSGGKWRDVMVDQLREDYHGPGPNKPRPMTAPNSATP